MSVKDVVVKRFAKILSERGMINAASLTKMKDGIKILNFAHGKLVDLKDIVDAFASGKAAAYVTDFPTDAQLCVDGAVKVRVL